jgi:hypothetical protein
MALPAAAMGLQAAGSLYGAYQANKAAKAYAKQQADFTNKAIAALEAVGVPSAEAQRITYETPELVFNYAPQLEQQFPDLKSQLVEIEADPRLAEAQATALTGIEERAAMGLTPEEAAELDAIQRQAVAAGSAQRASGLQSLERRGLGGSGMELISQREAAQATQDALAQASQEKAAQSFAAKQAALQNLANIAGSQRSQQFGEEAQKASAADIIAQFNRQQQAGTQQRNIAQQNQAELMRQQALQAQEDQRAAARNLEEEQRVAATQQEFANRMQKAGAAAGAYTGAAQGAAQTGATAAANKAALGSALGQAAGGIAQAVSGSNFSMPSFGSSSPTPTYNPATRDEEYEYEG